MVVRSPTTGLGHPPESRGVGPNHGPYDGCQSPGTGPTTAIARGLGSAGPSPPRFFEELGELWLLIEGYETLNSLPYGLAQEVRSQLGQTQKKAQLQQRPGLEDLWIVVGQVRDRESTGATTLKRQRTWLWGQEHQIFALLLDYVHHRQSLPEDKPPGSGWRGELVFYDGALQQRALLKQSQPIPTPQIHLQGYRYIEQGLTAYAQALARNPWCDRIPLSLSHILPVNAGRQLRDSNGQTLPLSPDFEQGWQLMALSGGQPLSLFGEWNGRDYLPLAVISSSEHILSIAPSPPPPDPSI